MEFDLVVDKQQLRNWIISFMYVKHLLIILSILSNYLKLFLLTLFIIIIYYVYYRFVNYYFQIINLYDHTMRNEGEKKKSKKRHEPDSN